MSRHLTRLLKSLHVLGLRNGSLIFAHYLIYRLLKSRKNTIKQVRLRTLPGKIWLRPGLSDWIVMERIFFDQEYDPIAVAHDARMDELRERILSEGKQPLIIDCGANIGLSAIWLSQRFAGSKVIAIEPDRQTSSFSS